MNKFRRFIAEFQMKYAQKWIILVANLPKSPSAGSSAPIPPCVRRLGASLRL